MSGKKPIGKLELEEIARRLFESPLFVLGSEDDMSFPSTRSEVDRKLIESFKTMANMYDPGHMTHADAYWFIQGILGVTCGVASSNLTDSLSEEAAVVRMRAEEMATHSFLLIDESPKEDGKPPLYLTLSFSIMSRKCNLLHIEDGRPHKFHGQVGAIVSHGMSTKETVEAINKYLSVRGTRILRRL